VRTPRAANASAASSDLRGKPGLGAHLLLLRPSLGFERARSRK
jgi:hypothetical protein